jgi:hypothetical protein
LSENFFFFFSCSGFLRGFFIFMSIHIILGVPGSGKSLYGVNRVLEELLSGKRYIRTNLPLNMDRLNEYVQKKFPDQDLRPVQRIRMLTDEETQTFWDFRGPDAGDPLSEGCVPGNDPGCAFYIDEAHIAFNAREWAKLGKAALFYLSQHRKLGDVVFAFTQASSNLDKQFRSVAEDFSKIRNEYTRKYGMFRGRGRFVRKTYYSDPGTGNTVEPFETATFTLDGVKECYDTARGVGVHGSKADIGRRAKGVSVWWVVPMIAVIGLSCAAIPWALGKAAGSYLTSGAHEKMAEKAESFSAPVASAVVAPVVAPVSSVGLVVSQGESERVKVSGVVRRGHQINVVLTDGRTLTERVPGSPPLATDVVGTDRTFVTLRDGTRYFFVRPLSPPRAMPVAARPDRLESISVPKPDPDPVEAARLANLAAMGQIIFPR